MKNILIAILILLIFIITLPVATKYHNLINSNNNKIDEYIDDTGVVYLRLGNTLTPKLDQNGKIIVKNKTL